ncbi:MAG: DUF2993 domain-containing protein [Cyanobacteria bacterium P01_D01_bin.105]
MLTRFLARPLLARPLGIAVAATSVLLIAGCNPANLVAQGIERELPKYVGPADSYDVNIEGLQVGEGSAKSVVAVGERVRPQGAPVIERLELQLDDVVYDRSADRLKSVGSAQLTAVIRTGDLANFLEAYRNVREAEVFLRSPDQATIRLRPQVGNLSVPKGVTVNVSGQLIGDGTQLSFEVNEVSAGGFDLSILTARPLSELINPLADLQNLPVDVEITSIMVAGETIGLEVVGDPSSFER